MRYQVVIEVHNKRRGCQIGKYSDSLHHTEVYKSTLGLILIMIIQYNLDQVIVCMGISILMNDKPKAMFS